MDVYRVLVDPKAFSAVKLPWGSTRREKDITSRFGIHKPGVFDYIDNDYYELDPWGFVEDWGMP